MQHGRLHHDDDEKTLRRTGSSMTNGLESAHERHSVVDPLEEDLSQISEGSDGSSKEKERGTSQLSTRRGIVSVTAALCICMMAHSYLLISVFPYSGYMAVKLVPSLNEDTAGPYAGILASALMVGRAITAYGWGKVADSYGRTTVLCISLAMASLLSLLFGFSPTFRCAVALRFCLGMSNGILGTLRTTVSEIAQGDEKMETRIMMIVMGMWSWGFLISPAISGALSDPLRQYPNSKLFSSTQFNDDGTSNSNWWLQSLMSRFPFLLPNLLGSILCFVAFWFVIAFVKETLPAYENFSAWQMLCNFLKIIFRSRRTKEYKRLDETTDVESLEEGRNHADVDDETHAKDSANRPTGDGIEMKCVNGSRENNLSRDALEVIKEPQNIDREKATMLSILARSDTRTYLFVYWAASFVSVAFNEIFPLFCMSRVAGLSLDERHIGQIMSLCGLIFAVCQYCAQSVAYNKFGLLGSIRVGAMIGSPLIFLVPLSLLLNRRAEVGQIGIQTMIFLAFVLALNRICVMIFYSNVAVAMNHSVPSGHRATAQGVCGMGENIAKGLGPPFAGFLSSSAVRLLGKNGSLLTFGMVGSIGTLFALCTLVFLREQATVTSSMEDSSTVDTSMDELEDNR